MRIIIASLLYALMSVELWAGEVTVIKEGDRFIYMTQTDKEGVPVYQLALVGEVGGKDVASIVLQDNKPINEFVYPIVMLNIGDRYICSAGDRGLVEVRLRSMTVGGQDNSHGPVLKTSWATAQKNKRLVFLSKESFIRLPTTSLMTLEEQESFFLRGRENDDVVTNVELLETVFERDMLIMQVTDSCENITHITFSLEHSDKRSIMAIFQK